jgi:hypothetical protein
VSLEKVWIVILCPSLTGLDEDNYEDTEKEKDRKRERRRSRKVTFLQEPGACAGGLTISIEFSGPWTSSHMDSVHMKFGLDLELTAKTESCRAATRLARESPL